MESETHKILIVEDDDSMRDYLMLMVKNDGYECESACNGQEALNILNNESFSLMVSDINMPVISGIDLLRIAKEEYQDLAVIMATAVDDLQIAVKTLEYGAYGYIIKPFNSTEISISIANALHFRELEINNKKQRKKLETLIDEKAGELFLAEKEILFSREDTIYRLARAAEFRDDDTAMHIVRMSHYCEMLATKAGMYADLCEMIRVANPMHDVGKVGIPDHILLKPGKLTPDEFEVIKKHPEIGFRILSGSDSELIQLAAVIALSHHEKFDGSGYPFGLEGDNIPIAGRITAICDVFDALTSDRIYKDAVSPDSAINIMQKERGSHFDPFLLDVFIKSIDEILVIKSEYADEAQHKRRIDGEQCLGAELLSNFDQSSGFKLETLPRKLKD